MRQVDCLPEETVKICKESDAVLLGAVGGWKWDTLPGDRETGESPAGTEKGAGTLCKPQTCTAVRRAG